MPPRAGHLLLVGVWLTGYVSPTWSTQLPDISFDNADWTFDSGVNKRNTPNGTVVCIQGDVTRYVKALLVLPAASLPEKQYYFAVDAQLTGVVPGPKAFEAPKLKVSGKEHDTDRTADKLAMVLPGMWVPQALKVTPSEFAQDNHLVFELSIQQAQGEFCSRSPRLTFSLPPPSFEYPWPAPNSTHVAVSVDPTASIAFNGNLLSANSQLTSVKEPAGSYAAPAIRALLQWLRLPALRFPGGTVGNFYNWRTDQEYTDAAVRCDNSHSDHQGFSFAFAAYAKAMAATNGSSVLMFNVIADSVDESVARLRNRTAALTRIEWIELGNECYGAPAQSCGHINPNNVVPAPAPQYIDFTTKVAAGLRSMTSGSRGGKGPFLAAPMDAKNWAKGGWNDKLASADAYDGYVMHPYVVVKNEIWSTVTAARLLTGNKVVREHLASYTNVTHRPLLLTEWGILQVSDATFVQTLGLASIFMTVLDSLRDVDIVQAGIHTLFTGKTDNPCALFSWDDTRKEVVATPTGVWYRRLLRLLPEAVLLGTSTAGPVLVPDVPGVDARAVRNATGGVSVLVVNKLGVPADLTFAVGGSARPACGVEVFTQPPLSWGLWPLDQVDAQFVSQPIGNGTRVSLPPLSIAVVALC